MKRKLVDKLYERKSYLEIRIEALQANDYSGSLENLVSKLADQEIELLKNELRYLEEYITIILQ